jgi:hypothetical protein
MTQRYYIALAASLIVMAVAFYFIGDHFGYGRGYGAAYASEHSHYLFEKARGDRFAKQISTQKGCISRLVSSIAPVEGSGFERIGNIMGHFVAIYQGTVNCNQRSGFATITPEQYRHIMGTADDN